MAVHVRYLTPALCVPALWLACCLPVHAGVVAAPEAPGLMTAAASPAKPVSKPRQKRPRRYSKATLAAFHPDPAQLASQPQADAIPGAPANAATLLSPVVQNRPAVIEAKADPLPVTAEPETSIAKKLMEAGETPKVVSKTRQLPSQEEGLALSRATAVPVAEDSTGGVSEEAEAKVEKGVDTGPMNLRVKKQALQMSVEIPLGSP